jgi:membrane protein YdbS with pleckstrin-like domain
MELKNKISTKALTVWKISGLIYSLFLLIPIAVAVLLLIFTNISWWIAFLVIFICLIISVFNVVFVPSLRWKRWSYEVREQEIELKHGFWVIKQTLIPMVRVQHVDTEQGPILRKYGLASLKVTSAATTHEIPAIDMAEADSLRMAISKLARVADDDV